MLRRDGRKTTKKSFASHTFGYIFCPPCEGNPFPKVGSAPFSHRRPILMLLIERWTFERGKIDGDGGGEKTVPYP